MVTASEAIFSFTEEQKVKLVEWNVLLGRPDNLAWASRVKESVTVVNKLIVETHFEQGNDLSEEQLDQFFSNMRRMVGNQALTRLLYEKNGIRKFNSELRNLCYGQEPLPTRVNQFFTLEGVGSVTMSQFLCILEPATYPVISRQTLEILGLDARQTQGAMQEALKEHEVQDPAAYYSGTLAYLQEALVFREIKKLTGVESYYQVNMLLWNGLRSTEEGSNEELQEQPQTSVTLEKDLRDYLAQNPNLIGRRLSLVGKEYHTAAGYIDILFREGEHEYVVVETKKGRSSDQVVGQILRYIGALGKDEGKIARGVIVLNERDERLDYAIAAVNSLVQLKYYKVKFEVTDAP